ncbi:mastermind-like protein 1 [Hemitrygon akajei]|uniref:mastermind-like protein 1 n=1 Tax=Hemitrygon akajei TaxID=2704970 RepID=UPI003BF95415
MAEFVVPRHSAVVERLRKRIELFRRHHSACESRYERASAERLELERQHSLALHQRCLQTKNKRVAKQRPPPQPPAAPAPAPTSNQAPATAPVPLQHEPQPAFRNSSGPAATGTDADHQPGVTAADQSRTNTLQALHERVKRKLQADGSPLNGDQQNGFVDGSYSGTKKLRLNGEDASGLLMVNGSSNGMPPMSPLHQRDKASAIGDGIQGIANHPLGLDTLKKECLPDSSVQINGNCDGVDGFTLIKELKQEPVLDLACMNPSGTSLSQNNMFPDINLNEQEWQELFDELNRSVPDQDIQDLFNEDFEEKKDIEPASSDQNSLSDNIIIKTEFSPSSFEHEQTESPQARPSPSGPSFTSVSLASVNTAPSVSQAVQSAAGPTPVCARPVSSVLLPGNPGLSVERSHAQQLQQMAANQKQRAQLMQKQQAQHSSPSQVPNWSAAPTQSPLSGPFSLDKPSSPSIYQQDFNPKLSMASMPPKSSAKAAGNYLQPNRVGMLSQPPNNLGQNSASSQVPLLSYANTKRLTHFELSDSQRAVAANQNKTAMFAYMRQQQQQVSHLSDEQKRMLVMKQKELPQAGMSYRPHLQHNQDQSAGNVTRAQNPVQGSGAGSQPPPVSIAGSHGGASYLSGQQQAVAIKQQQMLVDQQVQRDQHIQLMEQQKQQYLQRQQMMAEREKQRKHQEQQLQRHMSRPPPQYQDQQQNPYHVEQASQFQGSAQVLTAVGNLTTANASGSRLFSQSQNMIQMAPSQSSVTSSASAVGGQPELGATQYSNMHNVQQGMYNVGSNLNQILSHSTQDTMTNGQHSNSLPRQPSRTRGTPLLTGYGQNHLSNSTLAQQQHSKGPVSQAVSKTPLQRLSGTVANQSSSWQHQALPSVNNQNQPNSNLVAFSSTSTFHTRPSHPKIAGQQFVQGMPRASLPPARPMGAINSTVDGHMVPTLGGPLSQTNPPSQAVPSLNQPVPDLANFNSSQQMAARGNLHCNQPYQVRSSSQELPFNYGNQSGGGTLQGLPGDTDLMDSLLKNRTTEEWIMELDEFLESHH